MAVVSYAMGATMGILGSIATWRVLNNMFGYDHRHNTVSDRKASDCVRAISQLITGAVSLYFCGTQYHASRALSIGFGVGGSINMIVSLVEFWPHIPKALWDFMLLIAVCGLGATAYKYAL